MKLISTIFIAFLALNCLTISNVYGQDFDDDDLGDLDLPDHTEPEAVPEPEIVPEPEPEPEPEAPPPVEEQAPPPPEPEKEEEPTPPAEPDADSEHTRVRDKMLKDAEEEKKQAKEKAKEEAMKAEEKVEIQADIAIPNKIQYTRPLYNQNIGGKDYDVVIEIGFHLPPAYNVGDKIRIKDRSARRAGSEEAADFLNRESGHIVLAVDAKKSTVGGNGGWIKIESMEGAGKDDFIGGGANEHTADGAHGYKYDL
jgi:hypothetical protein